MSESIKYQHDKVRNELFRFIPFSICVALLFILVYILGLAPIEKDELADSDSYLRLLRVENLHKGGNWYDPVFLRINPPHGQTSHWTRPFDVLLLAGATPIALFTDFESALFWWGIIISPVLMIAALVALQWSTKSVLSGDGPFLAGFIFILQSITLTYYQAGRPDHHSLIILAFILSIGLALRMIIKPFSVRLCYLTGVISGFSMWVSVESILITCLILVVLGLFWALENGDFLDKSLHYAVALFVATGLSLVLERSWDSLLAEEYDRLSIVHVSIFGLVAVVWAAMFVLNRRTQLFRRRGRRISAIPACAAFVALVVILSFPKFYKGPLADIDPKLITVWFSKIPEVRPLISKAAPVAISIQLIGSALVGFPFLLYSLRKKTDSNNRKGWIFLLLTSVVFMLISIYQIRWSVYPQILLIIPMTQLMVLLRRRGPSTGLLKTLKNVLILTVFSAGLLSVGVFAERMIAKRGESSTSYGKASLIHMCDYLSQVEDWGGQDLLILTHVDFGAEIIYRTEHKVLGTPHASGTLHRNGQGILDTYDIMTADTDEKAHELIQKRKIDLILLRPNSIESAFYSKPEMASTFYKRLLRDRIPYWLRRIELPSGLSSEFQLFEIIEM